MDGGDSKQVQWSGRITLTGMAATAWAGPRRAELLKRLGDKEEAETILAACLSDETARLMNAAESASADLLSDLAMQVPSRLVVDVGVGIGDLAARLFPLCQQHGYEYRPVDPTPRSRQSTELRLQMNSQDYETRPMSVVDGTAQHLPVDTASAALVVWGRIGQHLVAEAEWRAAVAEVQRVLAPKGAFLQLEPLRELNPSEPEGPRQPHKMTMLRALSEYQSALTSMMLTSQSTSAFCAEQYIVAVWRKRQ